MSRRKQTKPLRLNEDEELQTGKSSLRWFLDVVVGGGDGSLSTVSCEGDCSVTGTVTGCLGHCTPGDINCYLTGPGEGGGRGEGTVVGGRGERMVSVLIIAVIVPLLRWRMVWGREREVEVAIFRYNSALMHKP